MRIDSKKMPVFAVRVHRDPMGKRLFANIKAPDREAIRAYLARAGFTPSSIEFQPGCNSSDVGSGVDTVIDWQGNVLRRG